MQKERAASALAHGLPVPTPLPSVRRGVDAPSSRPPSSASGRPSTRAGSESRLPLAIKFLALGLAILGSIYAMTVFRDHKPSPNPGTSRALLK